MAKNLTVANTAIKKKLGEFLKTEPTGEGQKLSKAFQDSLEVCVSDLVFEESKKIQKSVPMGATLPKSDASLINKLPFNIDTEVYYIVWKQVRAQVKGSLQVKFGWQFVVLTGKIYEVRIRHDFGVLYRINDDEVLVEYVFKDRNKAVERCAQLNKGTAVLAVEEASIPSLEDVVTCSKCGAVVRKQDCVSDSEAGWICADCVAKQSKAEEVVDGKKEEGTGSANSAEGDGRKEVSAAASGKSNE